MSTVRISDLLIDALGCTRHDAERWMRYGRVQVDGRPVTDVHATVDGAVRITLNARPVETVDHQVPS